MGPQYGLLLIMINSLALPIFRARKYYVMVKQTDTEAFFSGH